MFSVFFIQADCITIVGLIVNGREDYVASTLASLITALQYMSIRCWERTFHISPSETDL